MNSYGFWSGFILGAAVELDLLFTGNVLYAGHLLVYENMMMKCAQ
jgi:hypothetical protein